MYFWKKSSVVTLEYIFFPRNLFNWISEIFLLVLFNFRIEIILEPSFVAKVMLSVVLFVVENFFVVTVQFSTTKSTGWGA